MRALKKIPNLLQELSLTGLNKDNISSVNLYLQDEARFGLKTDIGRCLTARGVKPVVDYQHAFNNTYLYGSFSPINGDSFVYEIEGTTSEIFFKYLMEFSKYKPEEYKIILIDNAGFHSLKNYKLPENINLVRIPPYSPELNPAEKIWAYIKQYFKNKVFREIDKVKEWLHDFVKNKLNESLIKSITHYDLYCKDFKSHINM